MTSKQFIVWTHHMNCVQLTETDRQINKLLFGASVSFDEVRTNGFPDRLKLKGDIVEHFTQWDFETPWDGLIQGHAEFNKRAEMKSMWCFPHADLLLKHHRATEDGDFDEDYQDKDIDRNLLPNKTAIGPPGTVFLGGRNRRVKRAIIDAIKTAKPSILLEHRRFHETLQYLDCDPGEDHQGRQAYYQKVSAKRKECECAEGHKRSACKQSP